MLLINTIKLLTMKYLFKSCQDIRKFYDTFALDEVLTEHSDWKPDGKNI